MIMYANVAHSVAIPGWLEAFCIYYSVFGSVFYSILRLCEPVVLAHFKITMTRIFCCKY